MNSPPNPLSPPVGGKRGLRILINNIFPLFAKQRGGMQGGEFVEVGELKLLFFAFFKIIHTFAVTNQIFLPVKGV